MTTYDLGPVLSVGNIREVPGGTGILVVGPPDTPKREVALELLAAGQRRADGVILIGTEFGATPLVAAYEAAGGSDDVRLRIIDATGFGSDGDRIEAVDSPHDLTGIGRALSRCTEAYVTMDTEGLRLGLLSVTAMLERLDRGSVYKFCRTLADRVDRANYLEVAMLDNVQANEQTVGMLADAFDAVVELRDDNTFRVSGLDAGRKWHDLAL